jgi:hypothetical protein
MSGRRLLGVGTAVLLSAGMLIANGAVTAASQHEDAGWTIAPVLSNLNSPRGVAFDGQGSLYVAEAGKYFDIAPKPPTFGVSRTGKVDKYRLSGDGTTLAWSTAFDSVYDSANGGPEVLGPAGLSALGKGCTKSGRGDGEENSQGSSNACQVRVIISESSDGVNATTPGLTFSQIGHLYRLNPATGTPTNLSDVGHQQYAWAKLHKDLWQEFPDSNPYGVLVTGDDEAGGVRTFVVDAGSNTVSEVMADGTNRVIAFIPNDPIRDSTPTCVAQGPDGALYIGTLDLFANFGSPTHQGQSHVYRVDPNANETFPPTTAHVWANDLTTITSCTFDRAGNFWATEMFQPNPTGAPGDLIRIPFSNPSAVEHVGLGSLPLPGGIAQGRDGAMYVSVNSANTALNSGAVVKVASTGGGEG